MKKGSGKVCSPARELVRLAERKMSAEDHVQYLERQRQAVMLELLRRLPSAESSRLSVETYQLPIGGSADLRLVQSSSLRELIGSLLRRIAKKIMSWLSVRKG